MSIFLPWKSSKKRLQEAEKARQNRLEVVKALSSGQVSRRDLIKMGVLTAAGGFAFKNGLSVHAPSAYGAVPTGTPPSPIPTNIAFTQPMPRLFEFPRMPLAALPGPAPQRESNQTPTQVCGVTGPCEGRPPGPLWAHQRWDEFFPKVAVEATQEPIKRGVRFHPALPEIAPNKFWTFNGVPFWLLKARYGEPVLFRHHNKLPVNPADNGGFGRHTISTHHHNGHTPAESDGFAGAFYFPGQFYDYRWPLVHAGYDTINTGATDPRCGAPDDSGGIVKLPGDWRETESTTWFHDHMVDFTSQNVYKGNAAMMNMYSSLDRGNEEIADGVNLRLPSGTAASWGNTDYDVNLVVAEKALDQAGQMFFDIFNYDGFVGDFMTVNAAYKPFMEVERRKYRFRILNGSVSRFYRICLSDNSTFSWIANDGNLFTQPIATSCLDEQSIAERYEIVVDFSKYKVGDRVWMVNLCEHTDGLKPSRWLTLGDALAGKSKDPCVGKFLEFRVARDPAKPDRSVVPANLIELPARQPVVRERFFEFGRSGGIDGAPWTVKVDNGSGLAADVGRVSVAPKPGTAEIWHLINAGGGWDHPVHIHFEEAQTLERNGKAPPPWEARARKDVWRLKPSGRVKVYIQFREFSGTYVEHCHNTVHEDHAMLLRWDINGGPTPLPTPMPTPSGVTFIDSEVLNGA